MVKIAIDTYTFKENEPRTILYKGIIYPGYNISFALSDVMSVEIPSVITTMPSFNGCTGLKRVNSSIDGECIIPDGIEIIDRWTFSECTGLTSVNIPGSVTSIGYNAFFNCTNLTGITILAVTPPELGQDAFKNTSNCPIYVPSGSVDTYKTANGWSSYSGRIQAIQ